MAALETLTKARYYLSSNGAPRTAEEGCRVADHYFPAEHHRVPQDGRTGAGIELRGFGSFRLRDSGG
jgi:hypothetical protein